MADGEGFDPVYPVDTGFRAQRAKRCAPQKPDAKSAGIGGPSRLVCCCAQDMIEHHRANPAVHWPGGPS